jgi:hypothetical protein
MLANSSVTVTAGTGMSGGGAVALGSSVTLNNAGVTAIAGTANQIVASGATGAVTLSIANPLTLPGNVVLNGNTLTATAGAATVTVPNVTGTLLINPAATLTGSFTAPALAPGACTAAATDPTVAIAGATTSMVAVASPVAPVSANWSNLIWMAYVKSNGNVALHLCSATATVGGAQNFNIRLIN